MTKATLMISGGDWNCPNNNRPITQSILLPKLKPSNAGLNVIEMQMKTWMSGPVRPNKKLRAMPAMARDMKMHARGMTETAG